MVTKLSSFVRRKPIEVRVLLTAFEPYDQWTSNSSWLTLVELLKELPADGSLVTRRYPVNLQAMQEKLEQDLSREFDVILHLGQAPGASSIKLEAIAVNAAGCLEERGDELNEIVVGGPVAYRSSVPLNRWSELLRAHQIPSVISYHAGTFLCNAVMYLSHHWLHRRAGKKRKPDAMVGFIHLPLTTEQVVAHGQSLPSLPLSTLVRAVRLLVEDLKNTAVTAEHVA